MINVDWIEEELMGMTNGFTSAELMACLSAFHDRYFGPTRVLVEAELRGVQVTTLVWYGGRYQALSRVMDAEGNSSA